MSTFIHRAFSSFVSAIVSFLPRRSRASMSHVQVVREMDDLAKQGVGEAIVAIELRMNAAAEEIPGTEDSWFRIARPDPARPSCLGKQYSLPVPDTTGKGTIAGVTVSAIESSCLASVGDGGVIQCIVTVFARHGGKRVTRRLTERRRFRILPSAKGVPLVPDLSRCKFEPTPFWRSFETA